MNIIACLRLASMFVLVLVNMVRRKVALRTTNESVLRAMYEWFTSRGEISIIDRTMRFWHTPVKFYCMNCGNQHGKIACPHCGSKAVRIG
jgi:Zn finger protein HypA/HybF involved in hydrogenase expression